MGVMLGRAAIRAPCVQSRRNSASFLVPNHVVSRSCCQESVHPFPPSRRPMSEHDSDTAKVPLIQQLLDNPFLLLFIGVLIPMLVYTLWGVIDILTIPLAK
jgi:hypothetical protein